jgi:hypothetical protein
MWNMGELYAQLGQKRMAIDMLSTALSGFAAVRGRSSAICQRIDSRLKALSQSTDDEKDQAIAGGKADRSSKALTSRIKASLKKFVK